jgi:hypothetical protein
MNEFSLVLYFVQTDISPKNYMLFKITSLHKVPPPHIRCSEIVEANFQEILTTRQYLGVAAFQNIEDPELLEWRENLTSELVQLFSGFILDNCNSEELLGIVDLAVDIRNNMTRERAIYSCFWFPPDSHVNLDSLFYEFEGWGDEPLSLCLSPGLSESVKLEDGGLKEICIIPALVQMD